MELKLGLQDLLRLIMQLPAAQRAKLKNLLSRADGPTKDTTDIKALEQLLLSGPTYSEAQVDKVNNAREAFSAWRRTSF